MISHLLLFDAIKAYVDSCIDQSMRIYIYQIFYFYYDVLHMLVKVYYIFTRKLSWMLEQTR